MWSVVGLRKVGNRVRVLLVYRLHELADDEGYALYSLDLLLGANQLSLKAPEVVSASPVVGLAAVCTSAHL